ncbi:hypothetical protein [Sinanaerobacter sp. ZZT-01]|uniref:hypothetical protein n=1 Tax=Sinanaerobacter sp. ZZT-01 TaxID=3111540 RepID=UPI002D7730D8|nr:hypothetical protein [Sinanaerobacter sp. ZZT-01]WRR94485.1 hypothetical protein U5921_05035 [Sinanaerobacter sp. ZZT-01]
MKSFLIAGVITIILWIAEDLLCTKLKNPLWGGIIPLLTLAFTIYILATGIIPFNLTSFIVFLILNLFITEGWSTGREKYKKRQKAELNKIKAHNIDS